MKDLIAQQLSYTLNNSISDLENLGRHYHGKVRDNYYLNNKILMVTSDRVSAFDHVLGTIPFKGQILSEIACFWINKTSTSSAKDQFFYPMIFVFSSSSEESGSISFERH